MRLPRFYTLFALLLLASLEGRAADDPSHCHSLKELATKVTDCNSNAFFAKAAQVCITRMEKEIETQKALLAQMMAATAAATASAQSGRLENNTANLANLRGSIERLSNATQEARREVVLYSENFVMPGSYPKAVLEKRGLFKAFRNFGCYKNNFLAVGQVVNIFDSHIGEFKKVIASARALEARTTVALKKVDSSSINAPVSNRAPASAGAPAYAAPAPKRGNGPSSITGTEKAGQNERALQRLTK